MKSLLVFLSILCMVASPALAAEKPGGDGPVRVDADSSSTFDLGHLINILPLDTVSVPLYLTTPGAVTYIENRINWVDTKLSLIDVYLGAGVPDSMSLVEIDETSTEYRFKITMAEGGTPVSVGSEPIAYLDFQVLCGTYYGGTAYVTLYDDNNFNFYVGGGAPAAPLRDNGGVSTQHEQYLFLWENDVNAYAGQQDIPWTATFYQDTPGRLLSVDLSYDNSLFSVESVEALEDLDGGSVTIDSDSGGLLELSISSGILPADQRDLFTVHFAALDDSDDIDSPVGIPDAVRENACGGTASPSAWSGNIVIPDHTASVDLDNITRYTTATYYDVPVVMDSNHPVNAYELRVSFPADDIYFDQVVARAGFTAPLGAVDTGDTTQVNLNNGSGTDYDPDDLPATICYLRFRPWSTPAAGTDFDLEFVDPHPENEIQYYTDLLAFHDADITSFGSGTIHIVAPPGGGGGNPCCPALYTWNGSDYVLDNNILAECDGKNVQGHVTDYYRLTKPAVDDGGVLRFQIREDAYAVSEFSDFELLVFDRPASDDVHVTRDGEIVVASEPFAIEWARDHTGKDIKPLIESPDNVLYQSIGDGWLEVSLGTLTDEQMGKFAAETHDALLKNKDCPIAHTPGLDGDASRKLRVSVRTADGDWQQIAETDARHNSVRQTSLVTPEMVGDGEELVLRYSWERFYRIDVLEFNSSRPFDGDVRSVSMIDASRHDGDRRVQTLQSGSGDFLALEPGEAIDVAFDVTGLAEVPAGHAREYVFVSTGKYTEPGLSDTPGAARGFALDTNVPNPFNPTTTIGYSLAAPTFVELSVYDVRGALVRTLVSGHQGAGERTVEWDGLSGTGNPMASGVYFYRLRAGSFVQTRKMVLLK